MTIGEKIKTCRKAKHWSQERLGERAGCTGRAIGYWETGERMPRLPQLIGIADALGVDLAEFVKGVEL